MANVLLPTTVVGSYPQPGWLIDRAQLGSRVPRLRAPEIWRVPEKATPTRPVRQGG